MALSFGSGAAGANVNQGPPLELIQTEGLGFRSIAGETKLQLVAKWSQPPLPTASLLSIASHKGLVAAAGPDAVHIATTDSVRKTFEAAGSGDDSDGDIRPFTPQVSIPMQLRVSQLAFTADESLLVLSAETGGGLAVYDVQALIQGTTTQPAFELSTNGETLRSLMPNPIADKAELCALVTANGSLLMADLKQRALSNGSAGQPVLRAQVSCAAWSSKGKQLVAGCADGSVYQMTPDGQEKAHIPKPPSLGDYYVASLAWLENDVFLVIHNPTAGNEPSEYHIVTRHAASGEFVYQKLNDPVEPFGDKAPHHSVLRLRDFPPDLQDMLLVASTAVETIGLVTRAKTALATSPEADKITNVFTTTELSDDSKRAQLPMSVDGGEETFPVGVALDLSSKDKVRKPIPTDEMEESPGPLPALWVLNNEGVLVAWWIVYNDSIRQGTTFPGLAAAGVDGSATPKPATPFAGASLQPSPAPAFGASPALGTGTSAWGQASATPGVATSSPSRAPAFGSPSVLGGSAFGASAGLGNKPSVWGSAAKPAGAPAFGQSSFGASSAAPAASGFSAFASQTASPFASMASSGGGDAKSSPFSAFKSTASGGGFASLASGNAVSGNIFGSSSTSKPFGSAAATGSAFGGATAGSVFGAPSTGSAFGAPTSTGSAFGAPAAAPAKTVSSAFGSTPFVLGTTFKADKATADDNETTAVKAGSGGGGLFGSGFGLSLPQSNTTTTAAAKSAAESKDEDMDTAAPAGGKPAVPEPEKPAPSMFESTTPTTTPAPPSKFFSPLATSGAPVSNLFGANFGTTPKTGLFSKPGAQLFGNTSPSPLFSSTVKPAASALEATDNEATPKAKPALFAPLPPDTIKEDAPLPPDPFTKPKKVEASALPSLFGKPPAEPPLPPNPFSMPKKAAAEPAAKAIGLPEEAPLPPDPFLFAKKTTAPKAKPEDAPLPPDPFKPKAGAGATKAASAAAAPALPALPPLANPFSSMKAPAKATGSSIFSSHPSPVDSSLHNPFANLPKSPLSPTTDGSEEEEEEEEEEEGEEGDEGEGDAEDEEEVEDDLEDDDDDEGSGTDIGKDVSPRTGELIKTPSYATRESFTSVGMDASTTSTFSHVEMPRSQIFGDREAPALRPPRPQEVSPRSPSPQRPAAKLQPGLSGRLFRDDAQRSFSAPGMASQILRDTSRPGLGQAGHGLGGSRLFSGRRVARDPNLEEQRKADAARVAEEAKALSQEDSCDGLDRELDRPLEPTLQLAECLYILDGDMGGGDSVAAQTEAVYRDINRMVLVLKANSRNIDAFLRGHSREREAGRGHKTEEDLDAPEGWVLCDVDDLGTIVSQELPAKLRQSRVTGEAALLAAAEALLKEAGQLRGMHEDLARVVQLQVSPDQAAAARALPLTAEQDVQQSELRRGFTTLMGVLVEAEQQVVLLRTKVSALAAAAAAQTSHGGSGGGAGGGGHGNGPVLPTVEAVMRTIAKMTAMAEKRSGDIDVLEAQMRKLGLSGGTVNGSGSHGPNGRFAGRASQAPASPFSTPQKQLSRSQRGSGVFTPGSSQRPLFASPAATGGTPTRRKLSGYTDAEKEALRLARASRKRTLERLQRIQQTEGPRHIGLE